MHIRLADRFSEVKESATEKMAAATREEIARGHSVISFTVGEPNFGVPPVVQQAAIRAIEQGYSKYPPVPGFPELRKRIAKKLADENGLTYSPEQIVVTCGAKQAIFNLLLAVIGDGDEVVIQAPYWTSYPEMVKLAGGTPVIVDTTETSGFRVTPEQLRRAVTPRTKLFMINSPSNPTGVVYTRAEMGALAKVLEGTDVLVCSDEIYEKLIYDAEFASFGALSPDAFARTITINGFSKAYAMTGWRLGYAAGPKVIIDAMRVLQGQSTSGANAPTQRAGLVALDLTNNDLKPAVDGLRRGRDRMMALFSRNRNVSFVVPQGAFYLLVDISKYFGKKDPAGSTLTTSEDMGYYLLREARVGIVPGSGFGCEKYVRLSYAASDADIDEGSNRILKALEQLRG